MNRPNADPAELEQQEIQIHREMGDERMQQALDLIQRAQSLMEKAMQRLSTIRGGAPVWRRGMKHYDQLKAYWYAVEALRGRLQRHGGPFDEAIDAPAELARRRSLPGPASCENQPTDRDRSSSNAALDWQEFTPGSWRAGFRGVLLLRVQKLSDGRFGVFAIAGINVPDQRVLRKKEFTDSIEQAKAWALQLGCELLKPAAEECRTQFSETDLPGRQ